MQVHFSLKSVQTRHCYHSRDSDVTKNELILYRLVQRYQVGVKKGVGEICRGWAGTFLEKVIWMEGSWVVRESCARNLGGRTRQNKTEPVPCGYRRR